MAYSTEMKKMKLKLDYHEAQVLAMHIQRCMVSIGGNLYEQLLGYNLAEVLAKLYPFRVETKLTLSRSEAAALKIALATTVWPGDDTDVVLWTLQDQLPKTIVRTQQDLIAPVLTYEED